MNIRYSVVYRSVMQYNSRCTHLSKSNSFSSHTQITPPAPHRIPLTFLWRHLVDHVGLHGAEAAAEHDGLHPLPPAGRGGHAERARESADDWLPELVAVVGGAVAGLEQNPARGGKLCRVDQLRVLPEQLIVCRERAGERARKSEEVGYKSEEGTELVRLERKGAENTSVVNRTLYCALYRRWMITLIGSVVPGSIGHHNALSPNHIASVMLPLSPIVMLTPQSC